MNCTSSDTPNGKQQQLNTGVKLEGKIKEIIILNEHIRLIQNLTVELINRGYKSEAVCISQQKVTEKTGEQAKLKYNEAAARYGLKNDKMISNQGVEMCFHLMNEVDEFHIHT